jgi:hypothetical protein
MSRKLAARDCPPLLKDKWVEAKSKSSKNELFQLFLACGGDLGQMIAVESITQSERFSANNETEWFTADDLLTKYHGRQAAVDELIASCKLDPARHRPHPDFPRNSDMTQYLALGRASFVHGKSLETTRSLHWSGKVSGAVAIEMANNLDALFDSCQPGTAIAEASPTDQPKPRRGRGPKPEPANPPVKKEKSFDVRRSDYVDRIRQRCMDFIAILRDLRGRLGGQAWCSGLLSIFETTIKFFEESHDTFGALARKASFSDDELVAALTPWRKHVKDATEYITTADNMLGNKKRKFPVEPTAPEPPRDVPPAAP